MLPVYTSIIKYDITSMKIGIAMFMLRSLFSIRVLNTSKDRVYEKTHYVKCCRSWNVKFC